MQPKQVVPLQHHPLLCRPIVTTVRCYQKEEEDSGTPKQAVKERLEGERGYTPLKVNWKTSIEYMESKGRHAISIELFLSRGYLGDVRFS